MLKLKMILSSLSTLFCLMLFENAIADSYWISTFNNAQRSNSMLSPRDFVRTVKATKDGGFLVGGSSSQVVPRNREFAWIAKITETGRVSWLKVSDQGTPGWTRREG